MAPLIGEPQIRCPPQSPLSFDDGVLLTSDHFVFQWTPKCFLRLIEASILNLALSSLHMGLSSVVGSAQGLHSSQD
jgi:hypothetical protein